MIFPTGPEPAGYEDSAAYRMEQRYRAEAERQEQDRIRVENAEKMRQLRNRLESGDLDAVDPTRRWFHGLAEGERHGDRELAGVRDTAYRILTEEEYDPHAALAWLQTHRDAAVPDGPVTGRAALDWLAEHRTYNGGAA